MTFIILFSIIFKANETDITWISNLRNYVVSQGSPLYIQKEAHVLWERWKLLKLLHTYHLLNTNFYLLLFRGFRTELIEIVHKSLDLHKQQFFDGRIILVKYCIRFQYY